MTSPASCNSYHAEGDVGVPREHTVKQRKVLARRGLRHGVRGKGNLLARLQPRQLGRGGPGQINRLARKSVLF